MKKYVIVLLLIVPCLMARAQFNRAYNVLPGLFVAVDIEQVDADTFKVFALNAYPNNHLSITIFDINQHGIKRSEKNVYDSTRWLGLGQNNSVDRTVDGGYVVAGGVKVIDTVNVDFGGIIKFNRNGDTLWHRTYGDSIHFYTFYQAKTTNDGGIIAAGMRAISTQRPDGWLLKTDSLGNIEWQKFYSPTIGTYEILYNVSETYDGGYIAGGHELQHPGQSHHTRNFDPLVYKLDSLGNVEWRYVHDTPRHNQPAYVTQTYDSNYVFSSGTSVPNSVTGVGKVALHKLDKNGSLMWQKTYGSHNSYSNFNIVKQLADSTLIAAGYQGNDSTRISGVLVHAKANGDSIFVETYDYDHTSVGNRNHNFLWDVIPMSDGGFMACGELVDRNAQAPFRQMSWVLRVDSNGCTKRSNCLVGIAEPEVTKESMLVYPNPSKGQIELKGAKDIVEMAWYSSSGKLLKTLNPKQTTWQMPKEKGIYILELIDKVGTINRQKVVRF